MHAVHQLSFGVALVLASHAVAASDKPSATDKPLAASVTTGSLTYAGKTHIVTAAAPGTSGSKSIFRLKLTDGSVVLADRIPPGAKLLSETAVASAPDAMLVAQREREYWSARDREINQRLAREKDQESQRRREALLASMREQEQQQEILYFHTGRRVRGNYSMVPSDNTAYTHAPGSRSGIATYGSTR